MTLLNDCDRLEEGKKAKTFQSRTALCECNSATKRNRTQEEEAAAEKS